MKLKYVIITITLLLASFSTKAQVENDAYTAEGISWELAEHRKATISDVLYRLSFCIPEDKQESVEGSEEVWMNLKEQTDVILDFNENKDNVHEVRILSDSKKHPKWNKCEWHFINGHIVIPKKYTRKGRNAFTIKFTAGNQGLNRRDGYVYTLFVPDRAHTVFPCFDQPNIKGRFNLDLEIPEKWKVAQNGLPLIITWDVKKKKKGVRSPYEAKPGCKRKHYELNTPIPTYLFAFAVGDFSYEQFNEDGYKIGAFYRETDSARISQIPEIVRQVAFSMKWQEEFTGVKYPFPKYDVVILPGFQFGGMEHVGATFYNDNTLFLPDKPTPDEKLRRTELIAHETSHMWFGDAVTMNWFDDVWTKEVFANYFAAEITAPLFPEFNHDLNWLKTYTAAAMSQDRTDGRTSIRQPLDNMKNAGLIYNNIIYNKAPVMMRKMVELMGKEAFRRGIQKYVKTYLYSNATWNDLIEILDAETPVNLKSFSKEWVDTANYPHYKASSCTDQRIGREYGIFELSHEQTDSLLYGEWQSVEDGTHRQALLMNLNENYLSRIGSLGATQWMSFLIDQLKVEKDPLTALTLINYMYEPISFTFKYEERMDVELWEMAHNHPMDIVRTGLLRLLISKAESPETVDSLYILWKENNSPLLSINDYTTLSYELAIRMPEKSEEILKTQRLRITNPDRLAQFDFVSRAVNPSGEKCDSLFESLMLPENRRIEPWTLSVLYYLNHPLRANHALRYIRNALAKLPEIQRTGDIFFPANWCTNLLAGHRSEEAYEIIQDFLAKNPDMTPLLRNKILSAAHNLKMHVENKKRIKVGSIN